MGGGVYNYIFDFGLPGTCLYKSNKITLPGAAAGSARKGDVPDFYYDIFLEVQNKHIVKYYV